ncbi:MAG: class A beta-lactamase-related serine hydrolase [Candidatus Omnitrophica bacterium]|nr:class A beta-lactamase-related serine hydrolase [Candidatus Omnitrophota bacterium]
MRKNNLFIVGIILVIFLFLALFFGFKLSQKQKLFYEIREAIAQEAEKSSINYSLFIKDLAFPRVNLSYRVSESIPAASLLKVPILAVAFRATAEGKVTLDQTVVIEKKDITGGSGKLKAMSLPYSLTFVELLEFMISISDNTATNKVINLLGADYINTIFKELNLTSTSLSRKMMDFSRRSQGVENYTSAADIGLILEKIYDRKLVNREFSDIAMDLLKNQKVNDRIPRYLPDEAIVAHKTGLERGVVHDAGIVFSPAGDYIICVLVEGEKDYRKAKKFIAQSSLLAYNLYSKNKNKK